MRHGRTLLALVALGGISQWAQAAVGSCTYSLVSNRQVPGVRPSINANPGDVIFSNEYTVRLSYSYALPATQNDYVEVGVGWNNAAAPEPVHFTLPTGVPGLGVRRRHPGGIVQGNHGHPSTWTGVRVPVSSEPGQQSFEWTFSTEFVLTDPSAYRATGRITVPASAAVMAFGSGRAPRGCNGSAITGGSLDSYLTNYSIGAGVISTPPPPLVATCRVSASSRSLSVPLASLTFPTAVGEVSSQGVPISLQLENCVNGAAPRINFTDSVTPANSSTNLSIKSRSNVATRGAIRLRDGSGQDVTFGPEANNIVARSVPVSDTTRRLDLTAHLARRGAGLIEPGEFEAAATFVLVYP
ncbi:hypothetical protein PCA10_50950 [Metapseudomonas resinovorans NBRC 106553]|uniref:Fimbrial-type adhesion domain-containing protein n=1 Tax=Metapseudomonas resinovorans NBRC 106553 TaxID=1245471 RepID=S6AJ89_METRE|nr:hypothetical protein PCA10_50950 [Pseudomonas resinovorans NBRC 106553]